MSLDYDFAVISEIAGQASDGIPLGGVEQSRLTAALSSARIAPSSYIYRKDVATGATRLTEVTSVASFQPFGPTVDMSAGDELYVACDNPIKEIYVQIGTPGVWTGTGIEIGYSTNGKSANAVVANLSDPSNGFRSAAGVYRLTWDSVADAVAFSPQPGTAAEIAAGYAIAERNWRVIRTVGLTGSPTIAPTLTGLWIVHADSSVIYTDLTSHYNNALTDTDFTGAPAEVFYPVDMDRIWTLPFLAYGMDHAIHRRLGGATVVTPTVAAEYLANDGTWKSLPDYTSQSVFFTTGPQALGNPVENLNERWSVPSDWGSRDLVLPVAPQGSSVSVNTTYTGYHIRHRITAISPLGPQSPSLARSRARAYGADNAYGDPHGVAKSYSGIAVLVEGTLPANNTVLQGVNVHTGSARRFTIPANPVRRAMTFTFSSPLSLGAGQDLIPVQFISGDPMTNVRIRYYE